MSNIKQYKGLLIKGCGGHAKSVADVALYNGEKELVFIDDNAQENEELFGFSVMKNVPDDTSEECRYFSAYGDNAKRKLDIQSILALNNNLANIISSTATLGQESTLEQGCFIGHHVHIGPKSYIGVGCIINTAAIIEHNSTISDYTHISVNATICGGASIGKNCFIGAGAIIIDNVNICDGVIIGAGAVVVNNITQSGIYVGVPARLCALNYLSHPYNQRSKSQES